MAENLGRHSYHFEHRAGAKTGALRGVFFIGFLCIALAATAPLQTRVFDYPIYTPYIPFAALMCLAFLVAVLHPRRVLVRSEEWAFIYAQILIVAVSALSRWPDEAFGQSLFALYSAGLYLVARYCFRIQALRASDMRRIASVVFALLSIVAILQVVSKTNIGVVATYFGGDLNQGVNLAIGGVRRVSGTFGNANVFALVYSIYGLILIAWFLFGETTCRTLKALGVSLVMSVLVIVSLSRSGVLFVMVAQAVIYGYWAMQSRGRLNRAIGIGIPVLILIAIAVVIVILQSSMAGGLLRFTDAGDEGRMVMITGALQLFAHPSVALHGVGSGQFYMALAHNNIFISYRSFMSLIDIHSSVHNWVFQMAVESGIPALLLYVYALLKTAHRGWSVRRYEGGKLVMMMGLIVVVLFLTGLEFGTSGTTAWILTPVVLMLAWTQHQYDFVRRNQA